MQHIRKLFFVPVGLPGMGKSTLAKHIKISTDKHLNKQVLSVTKQSRDTDYPLDSMTTKKISGLELTESKL